MLDKKLPKNLLSIFFIIGILMIPVLAFADADKIFKENSKAVVVVVTYNEKGEAISQGSGFIVRADGAIVTNYHVVSNAKDIKVKAGDKVLNVEGLILADKENDIVILKVKGKDLPVVKLGDIAKINIGEKVYVISSPEGLENTISDGILSGIREITSDRKVLQITAPVSSGSSGGPVFNQNGEVIGVATFLIKEAQNLNFAMPVNHIKDKIESKKVTALKESKIEDYKKTAEYWFELGISYQVYGKNQEAIDAYKQAIRIKPDYTPGYFGLGATYEALGKYQESIDVYKQAIKIQPDDEVAHSRLGYVYETLGKYQEAVDIYKQAVKINPDNSFTYSTLGLAYGKSGNNKEAIEAFKQAIKIKPDYAMAHFNLGITYLIVDDRGMALEEYKILKELDKEKANELFNLIYK